MSKLLLQSFENWYTFLVPLLWPVPLWVALSQTRLVSLSYNLWPNIHKFQKLNWKKLTKNINPFYNILGKNLFYLIRSIRSLNATKLFKIYNYYVETILEQLPNNINQFKNLDIYCVHLAFCIRLDLKTFLQ